NVIPYHIPDMGSRAGYVVQPVIDIVPHVRVPGRHLLNACDNCADRVLPYRIPYARGVRGNQAQLLTDPLLKNAEMLEHPLHGHDHREHDPLDYVPVLRYPLAYLSQYGNGAQPEVNDSEYEPDYARECLGMLGNGIGDG